MSHKSELRVLMQGYWEGVEKGWPFDYPYGTGLLGATRGTLDGSPTDAAFPYNPEQAASRDRPGVYGTEGWSISNRAWLSTVAFSTLGSHQIHATQAKPAAPVHVELRAALNQDPRKVETGWVLWSEDGSEPRKVEVRETGIDTGLFAADIAVRPNVREVEASYGYLAARKSVRVQVKR